MAPDSEGLDEAIAEIKKNALSAAVEWVGTNARIIGVIVAVVAFVNFGIWTYVKKETKQFCDTLFPPETGHITTELASINQVSAVTEAKRAASDHCDERILQGAKECARALADAAVSAPTGATE